MRRFELSRLPLGAVILGALLLTMAPLALLTYFSVSRASEAVENEATARMRSTAAVSAAVVESELEGLADIVQAYAERPKLIEALGTGSPTTFDRRELKRQLEELQTAQSGIAVTFLAEIDGRLVDIVPATPEIVGKNFSFRDWYKGLQTTGGPYVSEAYVTQARGNALVVAAATFVRPRGSAAGKPVAILVAAYSLEHVQQFVDRFAATQSVRLQVTDQRGAILAQPGGVPRKLTYADDDPNVTAALRGKTNVVSAREGPEGQTVAAYAPVSSFGWTVSTSVPRKTAFAGVESLRTTVFTVAGLLALVLLAGLALLARTLWERDRAEKVARSNEAAAESAREKLATQNEELEAVTTELENQNTELELQTAELEEQQAQLAAANDELEAQQAELERAVAELAEEKERVEAFYTFGERLAADVNDDSLCPTILRDLCDFADAGIGTLYTRMEEDDEALQLSAALGVREASLPEAFCPGEGAAGRALAEERSIAVSYGATGLRLPAFGEEVAVSHELHVPLTQGDRTLGVVTLARVVDRPFGTDETTALEHLAAQAAVAVGNAINYRSARRQASINQAVLDSTTDSISMVNAEGQTVLQNRAAEIMAEELGLADGGPSQERMKLAAAKTTDPEGFLSAMADLFANPEQKSTAEYELAGSGRTFEVHSSPVRGDGGALLGRMFTSREVTTERETDRLKTELVATVSHELRTPLASILGFAELLVTRDVTEEVRTRYLDTIHQEAERLTSLINDFLDIQRMEEGSFTLSLETFDLLGLLRHEVDLFSAQSDAHTLELNVPDELVSVLGDRDRIAQVVGNLLSNAIKYSPEGGTVTLRAEENHDRVRVSIRDRGLGIPESQQHQLFTKFFRVDSSDTREIGGTGLGLALSREIIDAHSGRIGFDSAEGKGSTFWFELPLARQRSGPASNGGPAAQTVLVIEDDPAAASLISEYLAPDGYGVKIAPSAEEGLARVGDEAPAVICLDIDLGGGVDGWEALNRLKANPETAQIPVVICTAGNGRSQAAALGAADFLAKPFSAELLCEAVRRFLPEKRGSILVVDDDEAVRRLVFETLEPEGFELREAEDGDAALAAIAADRPDAVILDLVMPNVDGFTVLERLQENEDTRAIPVVVLTGWQLSAAERSSLRAGAVSLLGKNDYSATELRRLVQQALG